MRGKTYLYCEQCRSFWTKRALQVVEVNQRPAPKDSRVSLIYEPNGTDHNDLVLRIDNWAHRSDTYYYELDHPANKPPDVIAAIRGLLIQWQAAIEGLADGELTYLPHDFSDQYSGWIRCQRTGSSIDVIPGWSSLEGWAFYPRDFREEAAGLADFAAIDDFGDPIRLPRTRLLADVAASLADLDAIPNAG